MKKMKSLALSFVLAAVFSTPFLTSSALAIPEQDYANQYHDKILPFLQSGTTFAFETKDGLKLSAVKFIHPQAKGTILILPGQAEPWLKYGEVFYDLYQQGYDLYSYDHRGQGLSPHLVKFNSQIGHIDHFRNYILDLNDFVEKVLKAEVKESIPVYLLAHSMGGAIGAEYMAQYPSPFKAAILSAPMLQINTKPYAEVIAKWIAGLARSFGNGKHYAKGKGNYDPSSPFEGNSFTGSPERFWMNNEVKRLFPETIIGGPSYGWVHESIKATHLIRKHVGKIKTPYYLFQAGSDEIVKPSGQNDACQRSNECHFMYFPGSEHEILMEKDSIRELALAKILEFFNNTKASNDF